MLVLLVDSILIGTDDVYLLRAQQIIPSITHPSGVYHVVAGMILAAGMLPGTGW
jgi:hypothetical protein